MLTAGVLVFYVINIYCQIAYLFFVKALTTRRSDEFYKMVPFINHLCISLLQSSFFQHVRIGCTHIAMLRLGSGGGKSTITAAGTTLNECSILLARIFLYSRISSSILRYFDMYVFMQFLLFKRSKCCFRIIHI